MTTVIEVPYLVVGAGPVGLSAAHLLAAHDLSSLVVERRDGPLRHPAAHVINARTLEILRQAGVDMAAVDALASNPADAGHVNYVTRLNGQLIGRLPFERQGPEVLDLTPTPLRNISQHRLEPLLAAGAAERSSCDLRYRTEWISSEQDADGVISTLRDLDNGEEFKVRSRYVLAADGAASRVRKALGITMVGPPSLQSFIAIHFRADLRAMVADRLGVLHFVMDPAITGVFVAHDVDSEWVFMVSYDPTEESPDEYDNRRCADVVRAAIGDPGVDIDVVGAGSWHMSAQVADRTREGRIFLVGDAAHRFPPTGGLGLNTGVADVHGLIWKLAAVEEGWGGDSLLDTHQTERQPIAGTNCEQSTTNAFKLFSLVEALGLVANPTTDGLLARLSDPEHRAAIDRAVAEQQTHFDMIGLQLGYGYRDGAVCPGEQSPEMFDDPSVFEPLASAGYRLPHAWLADGRSTLDLVRLGCLTLISFGEHDAWGDAVSDGDIPVHLVRMGVDAHASGEWIVGIGDGAILVRPDQHIAWRSGIHSAPGDLANAVRSILDN